MMPVRALALLLAAGVPALCRGADAPATGAVLYARYCASCHGPQGRGDGPAAPALSPHPSDLTRSTASVPDLMRVIDGRRRVVAHGTSAMPVWGQVFEESLIDDAHARRTALHQVQTLADWVHRLR
jgi:mono/diheme cytochrome c family protein